jgi:PAS domain S-box-containing protein
VRFRDWPIQRKFAIGTLLITVPGIVFISAFLIVTEFKSLRELRFANTRAFVGMIATNAASAVLFDDPGTAREILSGITADPDAEVAAIYDAKGKLYAWFPTNLPPSSVPQVPQSAGVKFQGPRLEVFADIFSRGSYSGVAYLRMNLGPMQQRFRLYMLTVAGVAALSILLVLMLSRLLQRWTVTPLLSLSATAKAIAAESNYSLRARKQSEDEVGALVEGFNRMLDEIERSQARVQEELTERRRVEEALRRSEEQMQLVADNVPALISYLSRERTYLFCNRAYSTWFGVSHDQVVGSSMRDLMGEEAWEKLRPHVDAAFAGEQVEFEVEANYKHGPARWIHATYTPQCDDTGSVMGLVILVTDITARKQVEQALATAQQQLQQHATDLEETVEQRTAMLRETIGELEAFSYSIAHDMRAPLRSMRGFAGILATEHADQLDDTGQDFLRRICRSSERLDALIQDVLNYSRVVRSELRLQPVDLAQLTREIVESYPNLQSPQAEVILQEPLPPVQANLAALTQVLSNLLGNAVKFVAKGVKPRVVVRAERRDEFIRLWIEDNGIGIEVEAQKRLFQMFQRIHRADLYEGTGIGLAIVRKAVERMGGRVGVESRPDKGSRFWVELKPVVGAMVSDR